MPCVSYLWLFVLLFNYLKVYIVVYGVQSSPFKRQLSLRLNDLPSTMERQRSNSLDANSLLDTAQATDAANNNFNTPAQQHLGKHHAPS